ncbi:Methyltransferase N6AMT1 [Camellia lanceoleosa]|uniref:Methyltransferase N6AMT1 n=1 Tax=Camellia lanceoleosa TaxID=1840588 RepID=A0ACC0H8Q0_9ERIC|nr:Methyltransferase N6AMT1 [Camellia lanceoleosa]
MARSVHSHGVGGGMADSKVYTPIGVRSGSRGRGGKGGRAQNLVALNPKLNMAGLEKRLEGLVDVMVVNPPYVPTPEDVVGREGIASAWAGGENGRSVINKILPIADKLLSDRGWLYMVTLTKKQSS